MRAFIRTVGNSGRGLFVSTGGYMNEAQDTARSAEQKVTVINQYEFIDVLIHTTNTLILSIS